MHVLRRASCALDEIYKEAEELRVKHHRTQTIYHKIGWFYYIVYTIVGLYSFFLLYT